MDKIESIKVSSIQMRKFSLICFWFFILNADSQHVNLETKKMMSFSYDDDDDNDDRTTKKKF